MSTARTKAVCDALSGRLATIPGLQTKWRPREELTPPAALVEPPGLRYHEAMGSGLAILRPQIVVFTSIADMDVGFEQLLNLSDPDSETSIKAVLESEPTLGGVVDDLIVEEYEPTGFQEVGSGQYLSGQFTLQVLLGKGS